MTSIVPLILFFIMFGGPVIGAFFYFRRRWSTPDERAAFDVKMLNANAAMWKLIPKLLKLAIGALGLLFAFAVVGILWLRSQAPTCNSGEARDWVTTAASRAMVDRFKESGTGLTLVEPVELQFKSEVRRCTGYIEGGQRRMLVLYEMTKDRNSGLVNFAMEPAAPLPKR